MKRAASKFRVNARSYLWAIQPDRSRPYSYTEVAAELECSKETIRRMVVDEQLERVDKGGREAWVTRDSLVAWLTRLAQ